MAKILRIEKCSECPYFIQTLYAPTEQCFYYKTYAMIVEDPSIIHPDCKLEDAPEEGKDD